MFVVPILYNDDCVYRLLRFHIDILKCGDGWNMKEKRILLSLRKLTKPWAISPILFELTSVELSWTRPFSFVFTSVLAVLQTPEEAIVSSKLPAFLDSYLSIHVGCRRSSFGAIRCTPRFRFSGSVYLKTTLYKIYYHSYWLLERLRAS